MTYYIIIRGPLASGKSSISKELSRRINGKYFAIDTVLDDNKLSKKKEDGYISQKSFKKVNEIISSGSRNLLNTKIPVIFDGNFYWKSQIEDLRNKLDFPHYVFTLKAPLEVCIDRDSKRNKSYGELAVKEVYEKSNSFDYGIMIDVTKPLKECVDEIISYLNKNVK